MGPQVVDFFPPAQSVAVAQDVHPWIRLNEYPQRASVEGAIFVSPEPEKGYQVKVKGKRIEIRFADPLPTERTVVVTFGAGIKDLYGNQMDESFVLAFSTGQEMDRASISGFVDGMQNAAAAWVWAYPLKEFPDPDPRQDKAPFAVQPQKDGRFLLSYLPEGSYRVFVVVDSRRDRLWESDQEAIALPASDVAAGEANVPMLNLKLGMCDLEPPKLLGAEAMHRQGIRLSFSEPVSINYARITATKKSEIEGLKLPIIDIYQNPADSAAVLLTTAIQREGDTYSLAIGGIADRSGNVADSLAAEIQAVILPDSLGPRLSWSYPANGAADVDTQTAISLGLTEAITLTDLPRAVRLTDSSGTEVLGKWNYTYSALAFFQPAALQGGKSYSVIMLGDSLKDIFGNPSADSLVTIGFKTLDAEKTGSISGQVGNSVADLKVVLERLGKGGRSWQTAADGEGQFKLVQLPAGEYRLWLYQDKDRNERFSAGRFDPFTYSEPFMPGLDTVRVRARWETENVNLQFNR